MVLSTDLPRIAGPYHFDTYVHERSAALLRLAFLLTGDTHTAEDLVQSSLVKVMGRWDSITAGGDPHAYVRAVLLHTALRWRKRRWSGERPSEVLPERADEADGAGAVVARERLRRALQALPPRQRAAVVLRHYEDLTEADAARALGCSVGTVKSQTARGLERLRALLDDDNGRNP
ncbi:MAG TPA: SigE family RNA polymerase sigma factor [Acidimicrobiales bacterium]|nr:SigE family RNA polymerase sigma factor [Acidimicrobiales bacterium]